MKSKLLIGISILSLTHLLVGAQNNVWPPKVWSDTAAAVGTNPHFAAHQSLKASVLLKNGDSLSGYISLDPTSCLLLQTGKFDAKWISSKEIKYIIADVSSFGNAPTELYTLNISNPKNAFWRLIKKQGSVEIYDQSIGIFSNDPEKLRVVNGWANNFNEYMYLLIDGNPTRIYSKFSWSSGTFYRVKNKSSELLLKFINKRYHQDFKEGDFKTGLDMVDFILYKENNLEKSNLQQ
ncbi:MAG TPA: hypothetical protein VGG71_09790 [Chitinophagaceae bacterium]|jgi:hypothetical protein